MGPVSSTRKPGRIVKLGADLEAAILASLLGGSLAVDDIEPAELSRPGQFIHRAVKTLRAERGGTGPLAPESVLLAATEVHGAPKDPTAEALRALSGITATSDPAAILQKVRDKQVLTELVNTAIGQLQASEPDVALLAGLLTKESQSGAGRLISIAERLRDGLPEPPSGFRLRSLPKLSEATGGFYGLWAIGGMPKTGKSTLAWQIALDLGETVPVVVYDFENGFPVVMARTAAIFGGDVEAIRVATQRVYYADNIRHLEADLAVVGTPAVVIVDSVQKLPASIEYKRAGLDKWLHRFEALKKRGYAVLLVSEINRAHYGQEAYVGGYKETGEIEYTADTGIQILPSSEGVAELHVVANRHHPYRGYLTNLVRKREWLWKEAANTHEFEEQL